MILFIHHISGCQVMIFFIRRLRSRAGDSGGVTPLSWPALEDGNPDTSAGRCSPTLRRAPEFVSAGEDVLHAGSIPVSNKMRSAAPYSSTDSAKSATAPMRTSATAQAVYTCSSRPSFYGIQPTCSALSITYVTKGTMRHPVIWPIYRHSAGSTSI